MFAIGQKVRVWDLSNEESQRGVISYIHEDTAEYDVIYDLNAQEDCSIHQKRVQPLEPFELSTNELNIHQYEPQQWKDYGNKLFVLKDYLDAIRYYQNGTQLLKQRIGTELGDKPSLDIGTNVIFFDESIGDYLWGMISSIENDREVEVILSNDEDRVIPITSLICLPQAIELQVLYRTLTLNLAKCQLKRQQKGWAIRSSSLALAITHCIHANAHEKHSPSSSLSNEKALNDVSSTEITKYLSDGYYFRGKAFLLACRPGRASLDGRMLAQYDVSKAKALENDIVLFKKKQQKDNRKLARDIAQWVDQAMTKNSSNSSSSSANATGDGNDGEDIDVLEDEEEEEEHNISSNSSLQTLTERRRSPAATISSMSSSSAPRAVDLHDSNQPQTNSTSTPGPASHEEHEPSQPKKRFRSNISHEETKLDTMTWISYLFAVILFLIGFYCFPRQEQLPHKPWL